MIDERQQREGWGAAVIPRLARELHNELPEEKGYSERNIKRMLAFHRAYRDPAAIVPQPVAQLADSRKVRPCSHATPAPRRPAVATGTDSLPDRRSALPTEPTQARPDRQDI